MSKTQRLIVPLRILLVLAFAFAVAIQTVWIPSGLITGLAEDPGDALVIAPVAVVAELGLVGLEVLVVCTWHLLTMIGADRFFTDASMRWVNLIVRTLVGGWTLAAATSVYLVVVLLAGPWPIVLRPLVLLAGLLLVGAVIVMLVVMMRTLLRHATEFRSDLDEVI